MRVPSSCPTNPSQEAVRLPSQTAISPTNRAYCVTPSLVGVEFGDSTRWGRVRNHPIFSVSYGKRLGARPRSRPLGSTLKLRQPKTLYSKPPQGFEPWTPALRKPCSTAELRRRSAGKLVPALRMTSPLAARFGMTASARRSCRAHAHLSARPGRHRTHGSTPATPESSALTVRSWCRRPATRRFACGTRARPRSAAAVRIVGQASGQRKRRLASGPPRRSAATASGKIAAPARSRLYPTGSTRGEGGRAPPS